MKRRLSAVLLAAGLAVSAVSVGVCAEETENAATEQVTESVTEAVTEGGAEADPAAQTTETEAPTLESYLQESAVMLLQQLSEMGDEELQTIVEDGDASSALVAANWASVKEELGSFVEVTAQDVTSDKNEIQVVTTAKYDGVSDKTDVVVTYKLDQKEQTFSMEWEIKYPMSTLMKNAALNTVMGLGIVFLTLLFLSWLIGQLHIIPDMIEGRAKKNAPAPAPTPVPAPAAAPAAEEEELVDDSELVAVIAAAIAASENTSTDGFVVRSIKKANKKNWQRA